ncbi:hypothetical protein TWF106_003142 [Orbilia oligospora]|uniref:PRA1 family protein n=1 Tax=Orbilia oligospora TaxID=2813651 RepID=A0A6G1LWT0_ORBOL|nr:hypothetical protein TWF788_003346 [Orbilia oligospora]KAF3198583.1 hypothetical protein TWF679_001988 [Orbilia oligospora]KAF3200812.1 hypothetical protein TWF106_003142 [Orbilia oligospora]KAF3225923.1 hypothetical protein TWF191_004953 [Orbilia oligospora]KAF3237237.1 hypothetical protein TWF192_010938 [Orbilia oligospora]
MSSFRIPISLVTDRLSSGMARFQNTSLSARYNTLRPLSEFFDFRRMSKPANLGEAQTRISYNLGQFSSNYLLVFVLLSIYAIITNLPLLFLIVVIVAGVYGIGRLEGRDLQVGNFRATTSQLWGTLGITGFILAILSAPFETLFWLIGASALTILGHASFLDRPIENAFAEETV